MYKAIILLSVLVFASAFQDVFNKTECKVSVQGTSTLHDWHMTSNDVYTTGNIKFAGNNITADNFKIIFPVEKMESGKSTMNNYCYEALKSEKNPNITFAFSKIATVDNVTKAYGNLTIAGVTKAISVPIKISNASGKASVSGACKIKMTSFEVEPPTVMFGSIECGDEVTISFQFAFNLK